MNFVWALFIGALAYIVFCFIFKVTELKELMQRFLWKN